MTGKKRILIADNEIMDITIIKNQLEIIGFELAGTASNGAEAIKKISETNPDIILLDIKLTPEMDGIETATVIKEKSNIPVVFIIANENNNTIKRAKESGSYGFIMRPYDMAILQTTLDNALCLYKSDKTSHKNHKQNRKDSLVELNSALLTLYDKSPVGYLLINKHGVIIAANHKAGDIFGFNKEQLKNKQLSELVLEEYRDNCILILKQIFNYKTEQKWEMKIINCNTFPLHLLAQTAGAVEIDSETLNWIIIQDISEYKHIVITDIHGTIQYINPKFVELTGYTAEEAIGKNPRVLKSGNTPDIVYKQMWETITKGEIWKGIFQNKSKTGELYWESASIAPIKDENGTITNYIAVKENITDKITNISILKKKEEDIKLILNSTNEGIFGIDLHGKCTFCNKSLVIMLGYPNKDYIEGENIHRLIQPKYPDGSYYNEEDSLLRKASAIGEQIHVERDTFYRADGTCFPVEYWSQPHIQDGKMTGSIVTVINITKRIKTEEFILKEYNIQLALSRIYTPMMKHNISITEIAEIILSVTLFLARSQTVFVTAYDRITGENICYSFAETVDNERVVTKKIRKISVILDRNELQEPNLEYPFDTGKSFFTNESKILFKLEGEVSTVIRSHAFLSVPVMVANEIAGQIGISNPHTPYTDTDLEAVERIAEFYAIALNRLRDETELKDSEKKLQSVISNINGYIYSASFEQGKLLSVYNSPMSLEITGYHPEEFTADFDIWLKIIHEDDRKIVFDYLLSKQKIEGLSFIEHRIKHKNGSIRWVSNNFSIRTDKEGRIKRIDGFIVDITKNKKKERIETFRIKTLELLTSSIDFADVLNNLVLQAEKIEPEIICCISLLNTNRTHLNLITAPNLPDFYKNAIDGLEIGAGASPCGIAAFTGETVIVENMAIHPSCALFHDITIKADLASCWSQPIVLSDGQIAGTFCIYHRKKETTDELDLSILNQCARLTSIAIEKNLFIKNLTESINKLTVIMDNTLDLISYIDLDLNILFANRSHKTLLNFEIENMKGKSILEFIHPDDKESAASFLTGIRQNNDFKALRIRVLRNDGEYLTVETSGKPIYDNNIVIGGIISSHDISTSLLYEKSLKDAKKAAEKANKAKSSFLASMSHELRTPLNAIIGFGRLLEMNMNGKLNRKQIAYVEHIRRSGDHLLDMINDVLDLAKIESGKFVLDKKPFDIRKTITSFYEIIKSISKGKNIKVNYHIENNIGILNADEIRFKQIMYNLVSNAIKFTDKGGIISIDAHCLGEKLEITICDNGKGIAKDDHEKIFLPFEQLYCEDHSIKGTGLGLSITKHLVELHNGQIRLESDLGKGSKFIITLPERLPMTKDFINSQTETTSDRFAISESYCGRIMVVEDNEVNQELIKEILGMLGLSTLIAPTGEEAVEIALHEKFDLIFMDIDLPGIDGIESMKRMRLKRGFSTPIVALTAFKMSGDEERFISEGMDAVLNKPIDLQKLVSVLKKYLVQKNINNKFQGERTMINSNKYNIDEAAGSLGIPVERFKTIVERFFNEKMDNYLISLESAISGQDFQIIKSEAHKLRGAMANLKFDECADLLKTIEYSAEKRDNSTDFTLILDELKKNLENLKNSIFK